MIKSIIVIALLISTMACGSQKEASSNNEAKSADRSEQQRKPNRPKGPPSIDEIFKMDTNNDGKLSKSELKGPLLKDFSKIDTDNDGLISRTELENAPKPQRGQGGQPKRQ